MKNATTRGHSTKCCEVGKKYYIFYLFAFGAIVRLAEHITQSELAKRTGTSKSYISRIENGLIDPTISSFMRIVDALGLRFELTRTIA